MTLIFTDGIKKNIVAWCFFLSFAYALIISWPLVRMQVNTQAMLDLHEDIYYLSEAASHSSWKDIPKWWMGPWIYPHVGYYRPLTSMLYFFEYRLFHDNFRDYNLVSWTLHGVNAGLLFLLTFSLANGSIYRKNLSGFLSVIFFATPGTTLFFGTARALGWWPAQNDVMSLTFGILSLYLLDRYLQRGGRVQIAFALAAFIASVFSKEMGYVTTPLALGLIFYRKRIEWKPMAIWIGLTIILWNMRNWLVPVPWNPGYSSMTILKKAAMNWGGEIWLLGASGTWWPIIGSVGIVIVLILGKYFRWRSWITVLLSIFILAMSAQYLQPQGTWAMIFLSNVQLQIFFVLTMIAGAALFWKYRKSEPGLLSLFMMEIVYVPILQYGGPHYFYWPSAFLALMNACFLIVAVRWVKEKYSAGNYDAK
jgi:hypothetical protein